MATIEDVLFPPQTVLDPLASKQAAFHLDDQPLSAHEGGLKTPERRCNHSQAASTKTRTLLHC